MDSIEDVYNNQVYAPFLLYCQERNYRTMQDLCKCALETLTNAPDITPTLLIRIKALYAAYCKKHPDLLMLAAKSKPARPAAQAKANPLLKERLEDYFNAHVDSLIRIADVAKALGIKRGDAAKLLENMPWCKAVDAATYFYAPEES